MPVPSTNDKIAFAVTIEQRDGLHYVTVHPEGDDPITHHPGWLTEKEAQDAAAEFMKDYAEPIGSLQSRAYPLDFPDDLSVIHDALVEEARGIYREGQFIRRSVGFLTVMEERRIALAYGISPGSWHRLMRDNWIEKMLLAAPKQTDIRFLTLASVVMADAPDGTSHHCMMIQVESPMGGIKTFHRVIGSCMLPTPSDNLRYDSPADGIFIRNMN